MVTGFWGRLAGEPVTVGQRVKARSLWRRRREKQATVPCTAPGAIPDELPGIQPNVLKLDPQGYELRALDGCQQVVLP